MEQELLALRAEVAGLRAELAVYKDYFAGYRQPQVAVEAAPDRPLWADELTNQEYAFIELLLSAEGRFVATDNLLQRLPGYGEERHEESVGQLALRVRKKLGQDVIESQRGRGYRINAAKLPG